MGTIVFKLELVDDYDGPFFSETAYQYSSTERRFKYTCFTTIKRLLKHICKECHFSDFRGYGLKDLFQVKVSNMYLEFWNINTRLERLIKLLRSRNEMLELRLIYRPGGGADVWEECGIRFIVHTDEYIHRGKPHVHAKNSGDTIKIDLQSLQVTGSFRNRKKQKEAVRIVSRKRAYFYQKWDEYVCGLYVPELYYNRKEDSIKVIPIG